VLIPLAGIVHSVGRDELGSFWQTVTDPRVMASYRLSFGASLTGAATNALFGLIVAWVLVAILVSGQADRGRHGLDLPVCTADGRFRDRPDGHLRPQRLDWTGAGRLGIDVAYTAWVVVSSVDLYRLPFVVRTLQPALEDLDPGVGGGRCQPGGQPFPDVLAGDPCPPFFRPC